MATADVFLEDWGYGWYGEELDGQCEWTMLETGLCVPKATCLTEWPCGASGRCSSSSWRLWQFQGGNFPLGLGGLSKGEDEHGEATPSLKLIRAEKPLF